MKNKRLKGASATELQKLMYRMKKVYALWMVENIVNEFTWCVELPQFVNLPYEDIRKLFPGVECWGLKDTDRWVNLEKGDILLKITTWKNRDKTLRGKQFPYFVGGVMTEKNYIIFALDKYKVVTRSVHVDIELMPYTLSDDMVRDLERLKYELDQYDMGFDDLFNQNKTANLN